MSSFALGLTKTAVDGTLSLVKSTVEEEKKLREKVQNDLVFISDEFEVMRSFLRAAATANNSNDDQVALTLVRQLRYLAFDVEDCVEYVVDLDFDDDKASRWAWLRRLWYTVNCCAPPLPLDVAVADIKRLKARVEDVSQRNIRYNNLILHGSNDNKKQQQPAVTGVVMPPAEQPPDATTCPSSMVYAILRDAWEATGMWHNDDDTDDDDLDLQELVVPKNDDDHDLQVISIWGSNIQGCGGDPGTTSVFIRRVYRDPRTCKKFKIRAWVKLTHPFNHDEFVKSLVAQFSMSSSYQAEVTDDHLMKAKLMEQMREQRYLVVLEDVFTLEEWALIRMYLPDHKNGSRIVLSTPQLRIALPCTGAPCEVLELGRDDQFLCAFFKPKTPRNNIGEFYHQLRHRGVISMWAPDYNYDDTRNFVDILYKCLICGWFNEFIEEYPDDVKASHDHMLVLGMQNRLRKIENKLAFKCYSWVDVPDPFNLKVFVQRLFLNFGTNKRDIEAMTITEAGKMGEEGLIKWCLKFLFEWRDSLVVINGLKSMEVWELIKSTFLLSEAHVTGCMILVITNEKTLATHCVKDHKYQALKVKHLKTEKSIATAISKGSWHYEFRGVMGRFLSDRRKDTHEWINKFGNVRINEGNGEEEFGVFTVPPYIEDAEFLGRLKPSFCSYFVFKHVYYGTFEQIQWRSWVFVPYPFDLTEFSSRLLLDFYSDAPQVKETKAVGLMEGTIDPIEECRELLRNNKCLVVIPGLCSEEWDSIKDTFLSEHTQSIIVVDSFNDGSFGRYFKPKVLRLGTQQPSSYTFVKEFNSVLYTERCLKALEWIEKFPLVGREWDESQLTTCVRDEDLHIISVWGIPGVGKSSLVRTVYYKKMLYSAVPWGWGSEKFGAFAWVDVPSPLNLTQVAWSLLLDFYSDDPQVKQSAIISMMEEGHVPIPECHDFIANYRCLVVINGVRSTQDWDLIQTTLRLHMISSTIVVITTDEKVAMHCVQNKDREAVLNIRSLDGDVALNLMLEKIASEGKQLSYEETEVAKSIVAKCGRLPKVIATIGEAYKPDTWRDSKIIWRHLQFLCDNFMGKLETEPRFQGLWPLFSWLQSYFDACSDSIKPCIFYMSIFSAEKKIRRQRLLWRWIAEGYCRDTPNGTTSDENGEEFISELLNLSIIQQPERNKVFCEVNGFIHDYIISRPMEDNLIFALEGRCSLNSTRTGQHLTIRDSWDRRDEIVYESIDFSRLRSLTVSGKWESFFIYSKNINMRLLRVLDLEDATDVTNDDLEQIGKLLPRLKFLSLRGCTGINRLSSSMGGLMQLQTLDIRHTSIVTLPIFITKLQKLRYIRAGTSTMKVWDWEDGDDVIAADGEDRASAVAQVTSLPVTSSSLAAAAQVTDLSVTSEAGGGGAGTDGAAPDIAGSSVSYNTNKPCTPNFVPSFLSKLCRRGSSLDGSVKVPGGIKKLVVLHTLGVVNVNCTSCGESIFNVLKKLSQLRKLGVSGISKRNINKFCEAISGHAHLKSLSAVLDSDDKLDGLSLDGIPQLPKTLKSLKLFGHVNKLLVWIKDLPNLEKLKVDLTIENPEELELPEPSSESINTHLRLSPIEDGNLNFSGLWEYSRHRGVCEIQCNSKLHIMFPSCGIDVLKVHFSCGSGSSLQLISGLSPLAYLKEVWLKGYNDAHKQYMQQEIDELQLHQKRPVLKLVQPRSS